MIIKEGDIVSYNDYIIKINSINKDRSTAKGHRLLNGVFESCEMHSFSRFQECVSKIDDENIKAKFLLIESISKESNIISWTFEYIK